MKTANVIGSGPNGLAAAITLAQAGVRVTVSEASQRIGGACSTAEVTLPGFHHDLGSSCFPMGSSSPFFRSLPLSRYGFRWIEPEVPLAHPLDDGTAVCLQHQLTDMPMELGARDGAAWQRLFGPMVKDWERLVPEILGPTLHLPRAPFALGRFGLTAVWPATRLATSFFRDEPARALFAGCAAHSVMPLDAALCSAVGLLLACAAHTSAGWPVSGGGSQSLTDALAGHLHSLGGEIRTGLRVNRLADLEPADATLFDTSARAMSEIAAERLTPAFRASLNRFRQGPGVFKVDWALSEPIPWLAEPCRRSGTVHVGGSMQEIVAAEAAVFRGEHSDRPFVLLVQPSVCDPSRAPAGKGTAWGYCHVPNGSTVDCTEAIEGQIERFAPGFRDCILARRTWPPALLESWNPNLVGGDLAGGAMTAMQILARPSARMYATSDPNLFLCSSYTPPGGGVHGMCGYHAANLALKRLS